MGAGMAEGEQEKKQGSRRRQEEPKDGGEAEGVTERRLGGGTRRVDRGGNTQAGDAEGQNRRIGAYKDLPSNKNVSNCVKHL